MKQKADVVLESGHGGSSLSREASSSPFGSQTSSPACPSSPKFSSNLEIPTKLSYEGKILTR